MFQNDSDSALEDLSLHDVVPGTFNIEKSTVRSNQSGERVVDYSKESAREGTHVTWPIGRIEKDERMEVVFEIQGDSESEYKVADAQDYHGATFGDEVDEEPNLPEWVDEASRITLEATDVEPEIDFDPQLEDKEVEENGSNIDIGADLSTPQVLNVEVTTEEKEQNIDESNVDEGAPQQPTIVTPDVCPVCGTEASVGASSCETCSFQFS